jgi:hypothetical protein
MENLFFSDCPHTSPPNKKEQVLEGVKTIFINHLDIAYQHSELHHHHPMEILCKTMHQHFRKTTKGKANILHRSSAILHVFFLRFL